MTRTTTNGQSDTLSFPNGTTSQPSQSTIKERTGKVLIVAEFTDTDADADAARHPIFEAPRTSHIVKLSEPVVKHRDWVVDAFRESGYNVRWYSARGTVKEILDALVSPFNAPYGNPAALVDAFHQWDKERSQSGEKRIPRFAFNEAHLRGLDEYTEDVSLTLLKWVRAEHPDHAWHLPA